MVVTYNRLVHIAMAFLFLKLIQEFDKSPNLHLINKNKLFTNKMKLDIIKSSIYGAILFALLQYCIDKFKNHENFYKASGYLFGVPVTFIFAFMIVKEQGNKKNNLLFIKYLLLGLLTGIVSQSAMYILEVSNKDNKNMTSVVLSVMITLMLTSIIFSAK